MDKVVIYRSQFEAQQDQFWFNHPEIIVYGLPIVITLIVIAFIWDNRRKR